MSDEKSFSVCQEMLPLFRAVLKAFIYVSSIPRDVATASFLYGLTAPICMVCLFSEMKYKTLRVVDLSNKE